MCSGDVEQNRAFFHAVLCHQTVVLASELSILLFVEKDRDDKSQGLM